MYMYIYIVCVLMQMHTHKFCGKNIKCRANKPTSFLIGDLLGT